MRAFWPLTLLVGVYGGVDVEMGLCTAQGKQSNRNGWARDSWSNANKGTPNPHLTITFMDYAENVLREEALDSYNLEKTISNTGPYHTETQTIDGIDLDDVFWVSVKSNVHDILCIETLKLTAPNHEYNIIQDYDPTAYDPALMAGTCETDGNGACKKNWVSATGKLISFWTRSCKADGRFLTKTSPFQRSCHDDVKFPIKHIDECVKEMHECVDHAVCIDTDTKYECACSEDYYGWPYKVADESFDKAEPCAPLDRCAIEKDICGQGVCVRNKEILRGYDCECNECHKGAFDPNRDDEYSGKKVWTCMEFQDPCMIDMGICGPAGECQNSGKCTEDHAKPDCVCKPGTHNVITDTYPFDTCEDDPECSGSPNPCGENSICVETLGSYECSCEDDYQWMPIMDVNKCQPIDPCSMTTHECVYPATCNNIIPGEYGCDCGDDYTGDGRESGTGCTEKPDPCYDGTHECVYPAICNNIIPGEYGCDCGDGYTGDGRESGTGCTANPCASGTHDCVSKANCYTTTDGQYGCACEDPMEGDGKSGGTGCSMPDPCASGTHDCVSKANCYTTTDGQYGCACEDPMEGDGKSGGSGCSMPDPCESGTHDCAGSECKNLGNGEYSCECYAGFYKRGRKCVDIPECGTKNVAATHSCPENSDCVELQGSHYCSCRDGYYTEDGLCKPINPCVDTDENYATHDCVSEATCVHDGPNQYHCECNDKEHVGDGTESGNGCENVFLEGICVDPNASGQFDYSWVKKWKVYQGCRAPTCDARLTVVDAWKRKTTRGKGGKTHYGWSVLVHLDQEEFDGEHGDGWSVLARLPKDTEKGSFQVWNARFFNFYEADDGYYIVLENKYGGYGPKMDRHDKWSFNLIGERTSTEAIPNLLFWNIRYRQHQCYDQSHHSRSSTSIQQWLADHNKDPDYEVKKLVISKGNIVRAL